VFGAGNPVPQSRGVDKPARGSSRHGVRLVHRSRRSGRCPSRSGQGLDSPVRRVSGREPAREFAVTWQSARRSYNRGFDGFHLERWRRQAIMLLTAPMVMPAIRTLRIQGRISTRPGRPADTGHINPAPGGSRRYGPRSDGHRITHRQSVGPSRAAAGRGPSVTSPGRWRSGATVWRRQVSYWTRGSGNVGGACTVVNPVQIVEIS
jgi:hypothetical protein